MVFLHHFSMMFNFENARDALAERAISGLFGQLMVAMFFFYSGYGVMEAKRKRKESYIYNMPIKRILKLLVDFGVIISIYLTIGYAFGRSYSFKDVILAIIGWKPVGCSSWFVFAILCMYLASFAAFVFSKKNEYMEAILVTVFCVIYYVAVDYYKDAYWTDTVLVYALGVWYSVCKGKIEKILLNVKFAWEIGVLLTGTMFIFMRYLQRFNERFFDVGCLFFTLLFVLLTMKISIDNNILRLAGENSLSIYIVQEIPMFILKSKGLLSYGFGVCFIIVLSSTIILVLLHREFMKLSSRVFNKLTIRVKNSF